MRSPTPPKSAKVKLSQCDKYIRVPLSYCIKREEYVAQVPLAEYDDMIETFPSDRANQPFRMSILPWRLGRGWPVANARGAKPRGENSP